MLIRAQDYMRRSSMYRNVGWPRQSLQADVRCNSVGLAVAAAVLWAAVNELLIQPVEYTCYNLALEKVRKIAALGSEHNTHAACTLMSTRPLPCSPKLILWRLSVALVSCLLSCTRCGSTILPCCTTQHVVTKAVAVFPALRAVADGGSQVKGDPRVTVRLGTPISAYGQESRNRAARQRIPHRSWTDGSGLEHHQVRSRSRV